MRPSAGFLLRFFALAALLFALWSFAGVGDLYARIVTTVASPVVRVITGFWVSRVEPVPNGVDVHIRRGDTEVVMPFQPRELFSGVVPFLALVGASASLTWARRLRAAAIGLAALFVFHAGLMVVGPYMTGLPQAGLELVWVRRVNKLIDVFYGFYGLVGYAALPFLLWWLLVQPRTVGGEPVSR